MSINQRAHIVPKSSIFPLNHTLLCSHYPAPKKKIWRNLTCYLQPIKASSHGALLHSRRLRRPAIPRLKGSSKKKLRRLNNLSRRLFWKGNNKKLFSCWSSKLTHVRFSVVKLWLRLLSTLNALKLWLLLLRNTVSKVLRLTEEKITISVVLVLPS